MARISGFDGAEGDQRWPYLTPTNDTPCSHSGSLSPNLLPLKAHSRSILMLDHILNRARFPVALRIDVGSYCSCLLGTTGVLIPS